MANKNDMLVVAYYPNFGSAEGAAEDLKDWDHANDDIKLGAIAILTLNEKGEIEAKEVGQRETKSGLLWGTGIGLAVGILTAGVGLIPGMLLGGAGGAVVGSFMHESVGMTDQDREDIVSHLRDGLVALAVMADDFEVEATMAKMVSLGGRALSYEVPVMTAEAITTAAEVQTEAAAAVEAATDKAVDTAADVKRTVAVELPDLSAEAATVVAGLAAGIDITSVDAAKLQAAGVEKASSLYKQAATPQGREELAEATGFDIDTILVMEKKLDLMRIKGVGPKYATLLVASGVDSVPELAGRNPANLLQTMTDVNAAEHIVDALPSEADVTDWIAQAKVLPKVVVF